MNLYLATNAIGGSGHTAILKQLLKIDRRLVGVEVDGYFKPIVDCSCVQADACDQIGDIGVYSYDAYF
jgi:hypothetical protein